MSRYVDLDGLTWDGKTISSKIQEVKTKSGYMQGITVGWLWGDNVPHIDLAEHDKQIRDEVIDKMVSNLIRNSRAEIIDYKIQLIVTEDRIKFIAEQMKGEQNEGNHNERKSMY